MRKTALILILSVAAAFPQTGTAFAAVVCVSDATDDTETIDGPAPGHPQADLLEACVELSDVVEVSAVVRAPSDPRTEPHWRQSDTEAGWFFDIDDDDVIDHKIAYGMTADGRFTAIVIVYHGGYPNDWEIVCEGTAEFDGTRYIATVDVACMGSPTSLRFLARALWDGDEVSGNGPPVFADFAPDADLSPTVTQTLPRRARERLAGSSRIETAVAISQHQFPSTATTAYLARADEFADAVAAGVLTDGPILLVPSCGELPEAVRAEIARLDPQRVVALGGEAAVCDALLQEAAGGRESARIAGSSRIETAAAIARAAFPDTARVVYLARADEFADAVAGGVLTDGPILLVPSCDALPDAVREELRRLRPDRVVALGGPAAVCDAVLEEAAAAPRGGRARTPDRLAGDSRITTAIAISRAQFPATAQRVYLARADVLADAVAAGVLTQGPILLVPSCGALPEAVAGEVERLNPTTVVALGGDAAVCDRLLRHAAR